LSEQWSLVFALALLHSVTVASRARRLGQERWTKSWLAAAPLTATAVRLDRAVDTLGAVFIHYLAVCGLLLLIALVGDALVATSLTLAALTAGAFAGCVIASLVPTGKKKERRHSSRYAPSVTASKAGLQPSNRGLSHWPIARALSTWRPENARMLFMLVATFVIQAGTSAQRSLVILTLWALVAYLVSLLVAVVVVARVAGEWLRATPVTFGGFAWPLSCRASVHQFLGTMLAALGIGAFSGKFIALATALAWAAAFLSTYAIACRLSYRT
jgi:hypothetical protein